MGHNLPILLSAYQVIFTSNYNRVIKSTVPITYITNVYISNVHQVVCFKLASESYSPTESVKAVENHVLSEFSVIGTRFARFSLHLLKPETQKRQFNAILC